MKTKNYTNVYIAGKMYTLGGFEEENYLQKVATYLNTKYEEIKRTSGYLKQNPDYQAVLLQINIADDYFRASRKVDDLQKKLDEQEKELYSLKHELVNSQIQMEKYSKEAKAESKPTK